MAIVSCIAMMIAEMVCIAATFVLCGYVNVHVAIILGLCGILAIFRKLITIPGWIKLKNENAKRS